MRGSQTGRLAGDTPLAFCGNPLDRAEDRRGDADWLAAAQRRGRFLVVAEGRTRMTPGTPPELDWRDHAAVATALEDGTDCVLLGLDAQAVPHFALAMPRADAEGGDAVFIDARSAAMQWAAAEADAGQSGIMAQALALLSWHARHRFCARCGAQTHPRRGGYQRYCDACKIEHFPRTDPVAIMLVTAGDHCLMGRQARFPEAMYSALAGFVEAGETLEAAVRREVHEEAGIRVGEVRYVVSQPWPFPSNLMMGFLAVAESRDIVIDRNELEDAQWFSRDRIAAAMAGRDPDLRMADPVSIAHRLVRHWLDEGA